MKVRWSVRAQCAIEEIYGYVAADKPEAARRLAEKLMLDGRSARESSLARP